MWADGSAPSQSAEMPTDYDHDSSRLRSELDPANTPRMRRGPRPGCSCDLPTCLRCRIAAKGRRWYQRNKAAIIERHRENGAAKRRAMGLGPYDAGAMDRKALEMLKQEGYR